MPLKTVTNETGFKLSIPTLVTLLGLAIGAALSYGAFSSKLEEHSRRIDALETVVKSIDGKLNTIGASQDRTESKVDLLNKRVNKVTNENF